MSPAKRALDLIGALLLTVLLAPVLLAVALAIWVVDGRPVFYVGERMRGPAEGFGLAKFRTMRPDASDGGVSGGDKAARITRTGAWLRRWRLDEMPQLWNVIRGDISFVGPRPPLRRYVERHPALYAEVLRSRPGLTGLATLLFSRHEGRLLSRCTTREQTEAVYERLCVPRKARLDLIYRERRTLCLDALIMLATALPRRWRRRVLGLGRH